MFNQEKEVWRNLPVRRDRRHEPLVERLCTSNDGNKQVFRYIKDLMIFAAMVGYSLKERKPLEGDGISIILDTYSSDRKDAFIYLVALITKRKGTILKNENLPDAIKIFEEYCNVGLNNIQLWLDENPQDHIGIDTLSNKIYEQVIKNENSKIIETAPEDLDIDL